MRAFTSLLGWGYQRALTSPSRWEHAGAFTPPSGQGYGGVHTTQHAAYLLTIFHHFSLWELRPGRLVPSPLDCPVQELLHLPLREDVGVPQQLVIILINCLEGVPGSAVGTNSMPTPRRVHTPFPQASPRLAVTAPPKDSC